jgi:hypothetical protein
MSLELHIFIQDSQVPTRDAWQQAIEEAGFATIFEPTLDLRRDTGFVPTSYKGQAMGYEFYLEPSAVCACVPLPRVTIRDRLLLGSWSLDGGTRTAFYGHP